MAQIYTPNAIQPTLDGLLKRYPEGRRRQRMEPIYRNMLAEAARLTQATSLYCELPLHDAPHLAQWAAPTTVSCQLAICTLGAELDVEIRKLSESDMVAAAILSEVATAWLVAFTRDLHGVIREKSAQNAQKAGAAYRPGVGRWPLDLQHVIFTTLPADQINVTLTEELVMLPAFSTSLIIPVRNL